MYMKYEIVKKFTIIIITTGQAITEPWGYI
jgi:hypothetical protein